MDHEQLAFANHQLAGMLRAGIPLEGAIRELCATMRKGELRGELERLESDLAGGMPLAEAMERRRLPELYRRMVMAGMKGENLPGVLTMVADYYHRTSLLWTRLKGVLVYPAIVLFGAMLLSLFVAWIYLPLAEATGISDAMNDLREGRPSAGFETALWIAGLFLPAILITLAALTVISVVLIRPLRTWLGWRFPGFREARIAQVAAALNLMLSGGCSIREAVGWLRELERGTPVGEDLDRWEIVLQQGGTRAEQLRPVSRLMPPLFFWVLAGDGEDWVGGTRRASELYQGRAAYFAELLLNAALPVSILALGLMIMGQLVSLVRLVLGSGVGDLLFY